MDHISIIPWSQVVAYTKKHCNETVQAILEECQRRGKTKLHQIQALLTSDTGLQTFELCGHISIDHPGDMNFYVDTSAVGWDVKYNRPVSMSKLHGLDPIWHLHPVNSMPFFDPYKKTFMSNFFSQQDVDWCVTNPLNISVICNKVSESLVFPFPCIYVFMFVPHLVQQVDAKTGKSVPTAELHHTYTAYQRRVVPDVLSKIENFATTQKDCEIYWPEIVDEFRKRCIIMRYLYNYDEFELYRIIRTLQRDYGEQFHTRR